MNASFIVLADLGLERSANGERGLIVLAAIACALGAVALLRWWLVPVGDPVDDADEHGWPFMKRTLRGSAQLGAGLLVVLIISMLTSPAPQRPVGWSLIAPPHEVSALARQGDIIWAGGRGGLYAVDRTSGTLGETPLKARDLRGTRALLAEGTVLWIGCTTGLHRWDGVLLRRITPPQSADIGPVFGLCRTKDGALWIGSTAGAWRMLNDQWQWFGEAEGLRLPTVDVIYQDQRGAVWLGSREPEAPGLWHLEGGAWHLLDRAAGLFQLEINCMIEDHAGTLWAGTGFGSSGAAQRIANGRAEPPEAVRGLAGQKMRCMFEDRARRLWFCSEYDGVAIREGDAWRRITMNDGLPGNEIMAIIEDEDGTFWLGNERGLGRIVGFK